jgi:CHAT domain-containing protein
VAAAACGRRGDDLGRAYQEASALQRAGRLDQAQRRIERALASSRPQNDQVGLWRLRVLASEVALEREAGDPIPPLDGFPEALAVGALGARAERVRGQVAVLEQRLPDGWNHARQAERLAGGDAGLASEIALLRARLSAAQGEMDAAEASAQRAAELAAGGGDRYRQATALYVAGFLRMVRERFDRAMPLLQQALELARAIGAQNLVANLLLDLGICAACLGDIEGGRRQLAEAGRAAEAVGALYLLSDIEGEQGNTHEWLHEFPAAIAHYERALALSHQHAPASVLRWTRNLAEAERLRGNVQRAGQLTAESARLARATNDRRLLPFVTFDQAQIAEASGDQARAEHLLGETVAQAGDLQFLRWQAEASLAQLISRRGDLRTADQLFQRALTAVETVRADLSSLDQRLSFLTSLIDLYDGYVGLLVTTGRSDQALAIVEGSRARLLSAALGRSAPQRARELFDPRQVARKLGAQLLSYWVGPERSFAWFVTATEVTLVHLPGRQRLDELVEAYRRFIEDSPRDPRTIPGSAAQALFEVLVAPFVQRLQPDLPLVVSADGPLHAVPFAALVSADPAPQYLVERVQVVMAPSLALVDAAGERTAAGRILAIGDPIGDGPEFPALPHARAELTALEAAFPGVVTSVSGDAARPEAYLSADLAGYQIVHLAAHAVANATSPLDSTIVLSPSQGGRRLSVRDVLAVPLQAELVTLSACRSAGARVYSGEGLVGFAWAFLSAGAHQVVAGLWDVGDGSTTELMSRFYRHLRQGEAPARALRAAQLEVLRLEEFRSPYHWAAFNVYLGPGGTGEGRDPHRLRRRRD